MKCIDIASHMCLPVRHVNVMRDCHTWMNDIVSDKHATARDVFLDWAMAGKPRQGHVYMLMKQTQGSV
jgi:hypothetical protein